MLYNETLKDGHEKSYQKFEMCTEISTFTWHWSFLFCCFSKTILDIWAANA